MIRAMQDRFKTRIITKFGEQTMILTEKQIRANCFKNIFKIKVGDKVYDDVNDFDFSAKVVYVNGGFFLETPDITLITTN